MKYKVISQETYDERLFLLKDENGETFTVDFYTGGEIEHPEGVDETADSWRRWLGTFVGKTLDIEKIIPATYFTSEKINIINS